VSSADTGDGVREQYDRLAADYDRRWAGYVSASVRQALARITVRPGEMVLDVGCGTGALSYAIWRRDRTASVVGVDVATAMLRRAEERFAGAAVLVAGDVVRLPFRSAAFDLVVSSSSFHYWNDPMVGLGEIARVLRPGGRLAVTDWCDDYLACRACDLILRVIDPAHRQAYGSADCAGMLQAAGYEGVVVDRYKLNWLWGMMTASGTARPP
jgi:ubiquinone/menaquinone biosynthesis C-methylase UbiE